MTSHRIPLSSFEATTMTQHRQQWHKRRSYPRNVENVERHKLSSHAKMRAAQRGLTRQDIDYVLGYGHLYHAGNAFIYYLRDVDIPNDDRCQMKRLEGTAVIVAPKRRYILTVWRNRIYGSRNIRRKLTRAWQKEKVCAGSTNENSGRLLQ